MLKQIKTTLGRNLSNARGWRTNRKIVVFESDDWGSIRIPNKEKHSEILKTRIGSSLSLYDNLDSLEHRTDFQNLLDICNSYKDRKENSPIFTLNTVMQNPDFNKIRELEFNEFHGIPFFQSYEQYYGERVEDLWWNGINEKLVMPQFHAREHLNTHLWLKDLRMGNKDTHLAFNHDFFAVKTKTSSILRNHYLASYFTETKEEFKSVFSATKQGLAMFKDVFGFGSLTFIASNYCWPKQLEVLLKTEGVEGIQTQFGNTITNYEKGSKSIERYFTGEKNINHQIFTVRNVTFEPFQNKHKDWVDSSLGEIRNSFYWGKPAVICMHRVNFSSELNVKSRDFNLKALENLISEILKIYPDVEFMSSDELVQLIKNENSDT